MRLRLLAIWVSLALLLQWSRAQEDNIQEVSIIGGSEGESSDKNEEHATESKENGVVSLGEKQPYMNSTELTTDEKEPMGDVTSSQNMPSNASQVGEMDHQSGDDKNESDEISMGTNTEVDHKKEQADKVEPEKQNNETSPKPETPDTERNDHSSDHLNQSPTATQESPSGVGPNIFNQPPTPPEKETHTANETAVISTGGSPDYPSDGPQENTTAQPTTEPTFIAPTPPMSNPVFSALSCYSCMFCNKSATNESKLDCPPIPGKRNGCRTILVKDPFIVPGKKTYISRGCIIETDNSFSSYCEENEQLCISCYEPNCNIHNMTQFEETSASASASAAHHLLTSTPFLIWSICLFSWQVIYYKVPPPQF
ncbi:uncharacterized protein LOC119547473 [Drosophila subpulchrella]|uniref:uncharacterized protein LOC119547473 n=1 Tax=Drosophila subpulchrella TaxID=1486046 RepID=UPI0018A1A0C7|nr:uncharacterized protein LOC119547473 [Drosophila subpulchrella]